MKGEKVADAMITSSGSSSMSEFFRHGSVEERASVYRMAAQAAINEQREVIRSANAGDVHRGKRKI